ncbi:MAG: hypothetical protein K0Q71_5762, partial [Thermomicrobiales bacterium]|nr:hypothetical protein [Thermomicrobiales bacterium]
DACPAPVQIVDVEDVLLTYLPGDATRIQVMAVGDLTYWTATPRPRHWTRPG